ncbi:hypothetical protein D3C87_123800 [compost metagenome]
MKTPRALLLCLQVALCASGAMAKAPALKPLLFQADKNNLQVLPQRFEYTLVDADRLKVGDILIDATQVTFRVESGEEKGHFRIRFSWPAGLMKSGNLALKNNSGKAIYNATLDSKNIKINRGATIEGEEDLRSDIAEFTTQDIEGSLIEDMKYLPFMTFCIFREEEETHLYLCSKELYMSSQEGQMAIKARSSTKKTAQVEINGKVVGNQGIIYLNDKSETVAFKAQTQSGAFLEVDTRKKDVDFKDVITDAEGKRILLTASGAEPVDESKVKKISATEWKIEIPASRPVIYLKGEGDIPMRQEFYIRGPLPKEKDRPFLSPKAASRIYGSSIRVQGVAPSNVKISPLGDANSQLQPLPKNQFSWTLTEIPRGENTRRYLNVETGENKFVVGYDIFRGTPFELYVGARYHTPSGIAFGDIGLQWWFEKFLLIDSDATRFRWGLSVSQAQHLTTKEGEPEADFTTVELLWRQTPGFFLEDATWGLSLPVQMIKTEGGSTMAPGLGAFWMTQSPSWLRFSDWSFLKLQYFAGSSGGDVKLKSGYELKGLLYNKITPSASLRYGIGLNNYEFDVAEKAEMQFVGEFGVSYRF